MDDYHCITTLQEKNYESLCLQCGICCGILNDPCIHLKKDGQLTRCEVYSDRFREHTTVSGKTLRCIPIRNILHEDWLGKDRCAYVRALQQSCYLLPAVKMKQEVL
ncbi:MAG: hypothetical protein JW928_05145 [Candidatus Aureabacteria bacterium]|nr:hypothetical protein [Candidatus Auribacterota bacterium]